MRKRRYLRGIASFFILLAVCVAALSWWAGTEIASPTRRPLQDYHHEFLAHTAAHGVRLQAFKLEDGTPCLMAEPDVAVPLGARGLRVRDQLSARGLALKPAGEVIGTLVLMHGRRGRKEDYLLIAERFCAAGFRCLLSDLPGHGDHPDPIARYGMAEADQPGHVLKAAAQRFGFPERPAGLMGISMGGSVAIHSAARQPSLWRALVVISSFDALQPVIQGQASRRIGPWLGGLWAETAGWVYSNRAGLPLADIQPVALAANLTMPTLIGHGTQDTVIPMEAGRRLYEALPAALEKQWVEIPGADHDNVLITDFPLYATLAEWMLKHVPDR